MFLYGYIGETLFPEEAKARDSLERERGAS